MTTLQKIEKLNKECKESIIITSHGVWQINSYEDNTPLNMDAHYPYFTGKTITEVVNKAYKHVFGK